MGTFAAYQVWLAHDRGELIRPLDYLELEYTLGYNAVNVCSVTVSGTFGSNEVRRDRKILVMRQAPGTNTLKLENVYLVRRVRVTHDERQGYRSTLIGLDYNDLLRRRHVMYFAGDGQATKKDFADNMLKEIVRQNLGSEATTASDITGNGAIRNIGSTFSVAADLDQGPEVNAAFAFEPVLDVCQEIAEISRNLGYPLFFGVVPLNEADAEFRTWIGQPGRDLIAEGLPPLSIELGAIDMPILELDYTDEVTAAYALGPGVAGGRYVALVEDLDRINESLYGRVEDVTDARSTWIPEQVEDVARALLAGRRPRITFQANMSPGGAIPYAAAGGWFAGDKIAVEYAGYSLAATIERVHVKYSEGKETASAKLEAASVS